MLFKQIFYSYTLTNYLLFVNNYKVILHKYILLIYNY